MVLTTISNTTFGTSRMLLIRFSSRFNCIVKSPLKIAFSFALKAIGIIFSFINLHRV